MINNNLIDKRYQKFCKEIFRMAEEKNYNYFIFVSRKCFYYTKIIREEIEEADKESFIFPEAVEEIRDRDLLKEMDFSIFESKKILLVDDTLYTGKTLLRLIERITGKVKKITIGIAVFAIVAEAIPLFFESPQFAPYDKMCLEIFSYKQMSQFVIKELQAVQESRHSYVIDLPVFEEIRISEDNFNKLKEEKNAGWLFTEYDVNIRERAYYNGFFTYDNGYLKNVFGEALIALVIKCRYEPKVTPDNQRMVYCRFTPFAMFRSMEYQQTMEYFSALFADTEYLRYIQNKKERDGNDTEDFVTIYRAVIYTLSYFTGRVFQIYLSNFIGEPPKLLKNLSEVSINAQFSKGIDHIFDDFSICGFYDFLPKFQLNKGSEYIYSENSLPVDMKTIEIWFIEWLSMHKRDYLLADAAGQNATQIVTIEEIERKLDEQYLFSTEKQLQNSLICIILKALDTGLLSNDIQMEGSRILRCFKMGESSDILSEYDISVFYAAVYSYYNHIGFTDNRYQQYYNSFIQALKSFLFSNGYFANKYISEKEFDFLAEYFNMNGNVLRRELANKRHVLDRNLKNERRYIKEVMDFVYYLQIDR